MYLDNMFKFSLHEKISVNIKRNRKEICKQLNFNLTIVIRENGAIKLLKFQTIFVKLGILN